MPLLTCTESSQEINDILHSKQQEKLQQHTAVGAKHNQDLSSSVIMASEMPENESVCILGVLLPY